MHHCLHVKTRKLKRILHIQQDITRVSLQQVHRLLLNASCNLLMLRNKPLFHKNLCLRVRTVLLSAFQVVFKDLQVIVVF